MIQFHKSFVISLSLIAFGCGSGESTSGSTTTSSATPTFDYPKDDELRVNHLQAKATHNSYHVAPESDLIPQLLYTHAPVDVQLESQGVRGFEFDVRFDSVNKSFSVFHETFDKGTTCSTLIECLSLIHTWSEKNPAHHPIFIQIEPKKAPSAETAEEYFSVLEAEVLSVFPRERIITPDDVRGESATLREAILANGWPTLGKSRGKVAFFIDDTGDVQGPYTHGKKDLDGRLMFVDGEPSDPFAGILIFNDPVGEITSIKGSIGLGFIVRTRADGDNVEPLAGDTSTREAALASGAQIVSTDYPAPVDGVPYVVEIPDGTPSRCNPEKAPFGCSSTDIENPEFIK